MTPKIISVFADCINTTVEMMTGETPHAHGYYFKRGGATGGVASGVIGFAGEKVVGNLTVSFPQETVLHLYELMTGEKPTEINHEVMDSIGEISNIALGSAKSKFATVGLHFDISIPSVIVGKGHSVGYKDDDPVAAIKFSLGEFEFFAEVMLKVVTPA